MQCPERGSRTAGNSNRQAAKKGPSRGYDAVAKTQHKSLFTRITPDTQSFCVTASGNEVSLITLKLEVAKDMSLRALVDCGASNNFVRR